jgi:hypothetical protein
VRDLAEDNLIDRTDGVRLAPTYEATLLADLVPLVLRKSRR